MILNDALKLYVGNQEVTKFYLGGVAPEITEYIECAAGTTYSGSSAVPAVYNIILGNDTGLVRLDYEAFTIPDRFVVEFDGLTAIDTGYRGDASYQAQLNSFFGVTTPIVGPGRGTASFVKNTSTPTALVKVFAPLTTTGWEFTLWCPELLIESGIYYTNYNNSGKDVYVTAGYPISAVIDKSPGYNSTLTNSILLALDKWGSLLQGSAFNSRTQGSTIYTGNTFVANPLQGVANTSLSIYISAFYADQGDLGDVLGYAGIYLRRRTTETGTNQYNIPYSSYMAFNTYYTDTVDYLTPLNKNVFYYTVLHEIGHALGIGPNWHNINGSETELYQSFIVGGGDDTPNPLGLGLSANFFYTLQTDPSRTVNDIGKSTTLNGQTGYIGDADETFAFNSFSTVGPVSKAVSAYNVLFSTNLTAIPIENGRGFGSLGAHWDEGTINYDTNDITWGTNNRNYYGNATPGAPGLEDELMTPLVENFRDSPLSTITAGAAEDLGYTVDYRYADSYTPRSFNVYQVGTTTNLRIGWHGNTAHTNSSMGYFTRPMVLKRGLTYTFNIYTGSPYPIYIVTTSGQIGNPPATRVTTGVTNDGIVSGAITWSVPINQATGTYYLQSGNHTNVHAPIVVT
jgi:hypothetical protein